MFNSKVAYMERILEAQPGTLSCIVGTVYVDMPLKPNVLKELADEVRPLDDPSLLLLQYNVMAPPAREKYTSGEDKIMLEDESGRIVLAGDLLKKHHLVTGNNHLLLLN